MDKRLKKELDKHNYEQYKKEWRGFCSDHREIPLYFKDWFWDANCEEWHVIVCKKDGYIIGAFPFCYSIRKGLFFIENPWQVPRGGIWLNIEKALSIEKKQRFFSEITNDILLKLPRYDYLNIRMDTVFDNWSTFYWQGFDSTPQYTYTISDRDLSELKSTFSKKRRQRINTASKKYEVKVNSISVDEYWEFFQKTYDEKGEKISFTKEMFEKLVYSLQEHRSIQIRSAHEGEKISAVQIVFMDSDRMYYHFCTQLQDTMDAQSLLVFDALQYAMNTGRKFDFEGSMIKGPAQFAFSFYPDTEIVYHIYGRSDKYIMMDSFRKLSNLVKAGLKKRLYSKK